MKSEYHIILLTNFPDSIMFNRNLQSDNYTIVENLTNEQIIFFITIYNNLAKLIFIRNHNIYNENRENDKYMKQYAQKVS